MIVLFCLCEQVAVKFVHNTDSLVSKLTLLSFLLTSGQTSQLMITFQMLGQILGVRCESGRDHLTCVLFVVSARIKAPGGGANGDRV